MSKPDLAETSNISMMPVDLLSLPLQHSLFTGLLVGKMGIDGAGDVPDSFSAPGKKYLVLPSKCWIQIILV